MKYFLLLSVLIVACGSRGSMNFDPSFTESERAAITAGFGEWPRSSDEDMAIIRVTDANAADHGDCFGGKDEVKLADTSRGKGHICFFVDEIARNQSAVGVDATTMFQAVAAHEFGHWLSARFDNPADPEHAPDSEHAIMRAMIRPDTLHVTAYDVAGLP